MKLSKEMAVRLHRMMWSDMQKELGDNPSGEERLKYKSRWIAKHFPSECITNNCWLCEYASSVALRSDCDPFCKYCPISWPDGHCNTPIPGSSYLRNPISEILSLPAKDKKLTGLQTESLSNDKETAAIWYYQYRENLLSKASGIPASAAIEVHVKAIQEKAVDEYFEKQPAAKLASMDVDQAFKQYAKEQKEPIFKKLAEESGLDATATVKAHIDAIYSNGFDDGKDAERERILDKIGEMFKK